MIGLHIRLVVCDLDGTLCNDKHRSHLASSGDWDAYHAGLVDDQPHEDVLWFLRVMEEQGIRVVFNTGRPDEYRSQTVEWLNDQGLHEGDSYEDLIMRGKGQTGSDVLIKPQNLAEYVKDWGAKVEAILVEEEIDKFYSEVYPQHERQILILDDRDKVVEEFRNLSYNVWQVRMGSF